jgi:hypothetical protein
MPTGSWPTLAHDRRTGSRQPRKAGPAEKTQLPAISATEQQLQLIRRQIQELEQAKKLGKMPPATLRKHVESLSTKPPAYKPPLAEALAGQRCTGPGRSTPATQPRTARTERDRYPLDSSRGQRPQTSSSQPALLSNCTSLVLFKHRPASFGSLRLGGNVDTLESAALARRDRTSQAKDLEWLRCQRLFDGITWPPGPLNDDMRRAVGKWVRGTLSGPQCRVCLDFLGWPQPFGVENGQPEIGAPDSSPLDGALPILAGMPTGTEKGSDDLDYLFSKGSNEIITEAYTRAGNCCGELCYVEQIWLACRTLARRTFARCMQSEFPALPAYRTEEIMCEALRQKLVGEGLRPEGAWLRQTLTRKGIQGLDEKPPSKATAQEELEMYHRRQIYLRKELQRQSTILGKEEAYAIFGVTDQERLSPSKLKKQYRQMALECHPDKGGDMTRFHQLQTAYTQLASVALTSGGKKPAKRVVKGTEGEMLRQKVLQVHSYAETCTSAVQRCFCQMSRGQRFKDWVENVHQSITAAQSAGSAATNVAEQAENLAKGSPILKELNGLSDAIEACQSAGEDTTALSERTLEAVEEAVKMNPTDRRLIQVSQQRILALALHAALAATDAGMSSSEVGHCVQWAKEPDEKDDEPVVQKTQAAPPPPSAKADGPLGRSPREEDESKSDDQPKPEQAPKPQVKEGGQSLAMDEHKELVHRVSALNTDLLHMQQKLHSRLTSSSLQASATTKSKVFGLIAAFMDEACVEFGKRLQSKSSMHSALDNSLWWLLDETSIALAVPPGVQSVILRSALGLDAEAVRSLVRDELMPRLWMTAAKMRGRRSSLSARSSAGNLLSPEDDILMRECEERLLTHLKPMQPRGCNDTA